MPHKTPEARRAYHHRWRQKNRERVRKQGRAWTERNLEAVREAAAAHRRQRRKAALQALGGRCARCNESDLAVLEIDHVVPEHKKPGRRESPRRAEARAAQGDTSGLQVLCSNCHRRKTAGRGDTPLGLFDGLLGTLA